MAKSLLYSLSKAAALKNVSRQAIHQWLRESNRMAQCTIIPSVGPKQVALVLIPHKLLATYHPSPVHQAVGHVPKKTSLHRRIKNA